MQSLRIVDFVSLVNVCGGKREGQTTGAYFLSYSFQESTQVWVLGWKLRRARQFNPLVLIKINNPHGNIRSFIAPA